MNLTKLISAARDRWNQSTVKYPLLLALIVIADLMFYPGFILSIISPFGD